MTSPRHARSALALAAALAAVCVAAPARAQDPAAKPPSAAALAEARERFERGIDLFAQEDYAGALAEFKRAYTLTPYSVVLYNLGLTYAALGRPVEATDAMTEVLARPGSLSEDRRKQAEATRKEQAARIAELAIVTNLPGVRIEIDGVERGVTPLAAPLRIKGGPRRIEALLPGHVPIRKEMDVPAGTRSEVRFDLAPSDQRLAHVTVKTKLPGATVLVDGEVAGVTPLPSSITVLPGSRKVELRRPGYVSASNVIALGDGASGELSFDLEEDPEAITRSGGTVRLSVSEPQAVVTVDGRPRGVDVASLRLAPGVHRLRVERGGFITTDRDITVREGATQTIAVELEPTPETRAAYASRSGAFRVGGLVGVIGGAVIAGAGGVFLGYNAGQKSASQDAIKSFNDVESQPGGRCYGPDGSLTINEEYCQRTAKELSDEDDAVRSRDVIGYVGLGVGGAALAAGALLLIFGDDPSRYDREGRDQLVGVRVVPTFTGGPGGAALGIGGTF